MAIAAPPFDTVLIANRGEIAVRIARTCRAMGMRTVAVFSDADVGAPHVHACDQSVRIGPPPARESYLRIDAIVDAARGCGAKAIHPGYGFLAENADFAEACASAGIVFVGPPPAAMRSMGDKIAAKKTAEAAGVPTVPGYLGEDRSLEALAKHAERIGAPLLIKAAAGGGGKGMRVVLDLKEFPDALEGAQREAVAAFGNATVFLERYLQAPRHIEIQVLADSRGACIHLGERECSIQRRHQKILEETPSTAVTAALRAEMGGAAIRAALAVGYVNAGTVEFMLDADGRYYFLEMNTRLQVEHAITEAVTGVDLVREQLLIAAGAPLSIGQHDVEARGHAIEVRIYAEDPENGFLPSLGRITTFKPPEGPGLRNDAGAAQGSFVPVDYDPMLAKLIAYDRTREACIQRLSAALDEYLVGGVVTNISFLRWLIGHEAFVRGETTTAFIERHFSIDPIAKADGAELALLAAAAADQMPDAVDVSDPWRRLGAWRHAAQLRIVTFAAKTPRTVRVELLPSGAWRCVSGALEAIVELTAADSTISANGKTAPFVAWRTLQRIAVNLAGRVYEFQTLPPPSTDDAARSHRHGGHAGPGGVEAPMSGKIVKVGSRVGDKVEARHVLAVMEAMKMEHSIVAPYDGTVVAVNVGPGDTVAGGDVLVQIEAET